MRGQTWTDEEIGFLQENQHLPRKRLAEEMGRTVGSIGGALHLLRHGRLGAEIRVPWTADEDAVLIESPHVTAEALAESLPGRNANAINQRRFKLGATTMTIIGQRPFDVGPRPLIAKTCLRCDRILAGSWFTFDRKTNGWGTDCRACRVDRTAEWREENPDRKRRDQAGYYAKAQAITAERATRKGEPYTEADCEVLADQSLTDLQKALRLKRSIAGVASAREARGFKSMPQGLGDPERDVWVIDNPNAQAAA